MKFVPYDTPPTMTPAELDALDEAIGADTTTEDGLAECLSGMLRAHLIGLKSDRILLPEQLLKETIKLLGEKAKPRAEADPEVVNLRAWAGKK